LKFISPLRGETLARPKGELRSPSLDYPLRHNNIKIAKGGAKPLLYYYNIIAY
jgi:hypothetical protein